MPKKLKLTGSMKTYKNFYNSYQKKDVLFIIEDWNAKQEIKRYLELQASLTLKYKMKQGKG